MENGYNNGSSNNDYQFTRPENNASNYGGGYNNSEWIVTLIIMAIPCVNIIMCFVWGFGSTGNLNRRNFCRAYLIMIAVVFVLYLILAVTVGVSLTTMVNSSGYYY